MCQNPTTLPDGTIVACRRCRVCNDNQTNDWVGRCLAESRTAVATHSVTLTYGRDKDGVDRHERTAVLTYSDVQLWLKRLRKAGYPLRYLIAGEYGKLKGRAHWHAIIFWQDRVPPLKLYQRYWDDFWPHGHQVWKKPTPTHVKYCCKYIRKDQKDEQAQTKFVVSKVPHIGAHYFAQRALEHVKQGNPPLDRYYTFPEAKLKNGRLKKFYLKGTAFEKFMQTYVLEYNKAHPGKHLLNSELLEEWADKQVQDWSLPEKLVKAMKEADRRAAEETSLDAQVRAEFKRRHNLHYFGKNMRGFYETEWEADDEQEEPWK